MDLVEYPPLGRRKNAPRRVAARARFAPTPIGRREHVVVEAVDIDRGDGNSTPTLTHQYNPGIDNGFENVLAHLDQSKWRVALCEPTAE